MNKDCYFFNESSSTLWQKQDFKAALHMSHDLMKHFVFSSSKLDRVGGLCKLYLPPK